MNGPDKTEMSLSNYDVYQLYKEGKRLTRQTVNISAIKIQQALELQRGKVGEKKQLSASKTKKTKEKALVPQMIEKKSKHKFKLVQDDAPEIIKKVKLIPTQKHIDQINLRENRCSLCKFILFYPSYKQCSECLKTIHENCFNQHSEKGTTKNKDWICSDCQPCSICEKMKADTPIVKCEECQQKLHLSCGFGLDSNHCYCPQCVKCQWCKRSLKTYKYRIVLGEFLCYDCEDIKNKKQYCLVCKTVWINNDAEYKREYIQCVSKDCEMWVHKDCDPVLKDDPSLFKSYSKDQRSVYRCPKCRKQIRCGIIDDTIRFLSYFDVDKLFWMVDYSNCKYLQVIKTPMDFVTLYAKNKKGLYMSIPNPYRAFMSDVKLILDNCLLYNLPNTKFHRKALFLQVIYNILFPILKHKLFDLEEISILEYSEKQMGLVNLIAVVIKELGRQFLDEAFTTTNNQVTVLGQPWDGVWDRQQLAFSPSQAYKEDNAKDERLLVAHERKYNPALQLEDKNEPLIKFSFREFTNHLLSSQMQVKIGGINGLIGRTKIQLHPYLQYLITQSTLTTTHDPELVPMDQNSNQQGFESELQIIFTKILTKDLSKMKNQPCAMPTSFELMTEFICQSCGTYESKNNLLFCGNCGESHHFFCQIQNANLVPLRVLASLASNIQKQWFCSKCVQCQLCRKTNSKQIDLFCHNCGHFYHFKCIFPQFIALTDALDYWRCPRCFKCEICATRIYLEDGNLELLQQRVDITQTGGQLLLSLDYFQNFLCCLSCGMEETRKRFCDHCGEYVLIDPEREVVLPVTAKNAYRQYLQPIFWEYSKQQDNVFNIYFEDIIHLSKIKRRQCLNYLSRESQKEPSHHCKRCNRRYHDLCLKLEGREFNEKYQSTYSCRGFCQHCQLDYSEVVFKYEQCKQEQVRRQYQERKLKQVQPFLFFFLEDFHRKQLTDSTTQQLYPDLTHEQTQIILENLDQFEPLICQFKQSFSAIQEVKKDFLHQPDISDDYVEKLIYFWSLKFGSLDYSPKQNFIREEVINYQVPEDFHQRQLECLLLREGGFGNYLTFSYLTEFSRYHYKIFRWGAFDWYDDLQLCLSELQCNFVEQYVCTPHFKYVRDEFYAHEMEICSKHPHRLLSFVPGMSGPKTIRNHLAYKYQTYKVVYCSHHILQSQVIFVAGNRGALNQEILRLKNAHTDEEINEQFKRLVLSVTQLNECVMEMSELYAAALQSDASLHQPDEGGVSRMVPRLTLQDQAKNALEKVNKIIQTVANQKQEDTLLSSPLDGLPCQICWQCGHRRMSGRLLYCDGTRWVHSNCALWSSEVKETYQEYLLSGVFQVLKILRNTQVKCCLCTQQGASLSCISANCKKKFHFYCAYSHGYIFLSSKRIICDSCMVDVQAYCVDQFKYVFRQCRVSQSSERPKSSLLKNVLNDAMSSQAVNDFSCWRRINVVNSQQKHDKQLSVGEQHLRFGNTVLFELSQSDNRPLFGRICILINSYFNVESSHKFVSITFKNAEYTLSYKEYTKSQLGTFLATQMLNDALPGVMPLHKIFDEGEHFTLRSFQQLQQLLLERKFFPQHLGELTTYEDSIGHTFLLFTHYVRTKLHEKAKLCTPTLQYEQLTQYYQWFFVEGAHEDLPQQARLLHLHTMSTHTTLPEQPNVALQGKHPSLIDASPTITISQLCSPKKLILSPQMNNNLKDVVDRFTLQGGLTPNDIFLEADLEVQNNYNQNCVNEGERNKELERSLKADYQLIEQGKKKPIHLYVAPSRIHKYGLFAKQKIKQSELVIEYTGELIRNALADEREHTYVDKGFGDCYMFRATKERVIDATFLGSQARYLNHSCDPNCASSICEFNQEPKILMYAKREIQQNEELTYDYQFEVEADKIQCFCGAYNCLGRLN